MIKNFFCVACLCVLSSCSNVTVENPTDSFLPGKKISKLEHEKLGEISGGAASINNPGYFWVHNDSGNPAEVYLIDESLKILLTCTLDVENRDWEDIAVGPGPDPDKNYIYVGEIGDNNSRYETKFIYRFEEPKWNQETGLMKIDQLDTITFKLEGKKKDTETLLVDPATKDIYIISKREEPVWVYRIKYPYSTDSAIVATKVLSLPYTQIVAGDFSPDGKKLLLKNYEHVFYWENEKNLSIAELLKQKPFEVRYELEPQGETIMWARDESCFFTVSEKNVGKNSYLYRYEKNKKRNSH